MVSANSDLSLYRASGISPAAPALAGPVFSQEKIPFLQKASNKQSASVILVLKLLY